MSDLSVQFAEADRLFARKRLWNFGIPAAILAYLVYVFFAFNMPDLIRKADADNAKLLVADMYSYKVHVTRDNRSAEVSVSVEGEKTGRYAPGTSPGLGGAGRRDGDRSGRRPRRDLWSRNNHL